MNLNDELWFKEFKYTANFKENTIGELIIRGHFWVSLFFGYPFFFSKAENLDD